MAGAETDAAMLLLEGENATTAETDTSVLLPQSDQHTLHTEEALVREDPAVNPSQDDQNLHNGENGVDSAEPSIDIFIRNVVCTFSVRCHLNLKKIGMEGINVEYKREYGKVNMRFRKPDATCTIWSSGRVSITGNSSEDDARKTARRCARALQKLGFKVRYSNFQVVNVLGTCAMPFGIKIAPFSMEHPGPASYEPELHPAVTYRLKSPHATLKIFSTGSITVTAPSVENISLAIQHIYPLVKPHGTEVHRDTILKRKMKGDKKRKRQKIEPSDSEEDEDEDSDFNSEDEDSDNDL